MGSAIYKIYFPGFRSHLHPAIFSCTKPFILQLDIENLCVLPYYFNVLLNTLYYCSMQHTEGMQVAHHRSDLIYHVRRVSRGDWQEDGGRVSKWNVNAPVLKIFWILKISSPSQPCSCGSVVEHCVSSTKDVGSIPREHTYWQKNKL